MALDTATYKNGAGTSQDVVVDDLGAAGVVTVFKLLIAADGSGAGSDLLSATNPLPTREVPFGTTTGGAITVGTSAVPIPTTPLTNRRRIEVVNPGAIAIYLGFSSGVTTANAPIVLQAYQGWGGNLGPGVALHAISGTASQELRYAEFAT